MKISYELYNSLGTLVLTLEDDHVAFQPHNNAKTTPLTLTIEDPNREPKRLQVERAAAQKVLDLLGSARINPFAPGPAGVDGATHTLTVGEDRREATYTWWCDAEEGWVALDRIANEIVALGRRYNGDPFSNLGE